MTAKIEIIVVGAGVVGLAITRALALSGHEVICLEAEEIIGSGTSSRNSEVIHAGIYYPNGSLMARLCVEGRQMLYDYCAEHGVGYRTCGKLIVATNAAEEARLAAIAGHARGNGVTDLQPLNKSEIQALEPELAAEAALFSPSTGIIDSHALMLSLEGDAERAGALFAFRTPVLRAQSEPGGLVVQVGGAEPMALHCRVLINAAGLGSTALARQISGIREDAIPTSYLAKGSYFSLSSRVPFRHLIYPVPVPGGLGTHLTLDLGGRAKFGPDVEWVETENYEVDPARAGSFVTAIRRYWPGLPTGDLVPDYAGIRPKITAPGAPAADFMVQTRKSHGVAGLINLFGIESPGLTSSLSIGDYVTSLANSA